jgi:hypothetical protein
MPGATPVYGLPYPISTDRLDDAITTIPEDLALAVESTIASFGGIAAPGAWQTPAAFGTSWSDYGAGQEAVRYRKVGQEVIGVGLAKRTAGAVTTIYTLPVGFRPTRQTFRTTVIHGATVGALQIDTTGVITAPSAYVNGNHIPVYFSFWLDQPA